jgi:hypothetical protein
MFRTQVSKEQPFGKKRSGEISSILQSANEYGFKEVSNVDMSGLISMTKEKFDKKYV